MILTSAVQVFHRGQVLPNHSVVTVTAVGEDMEGVFCLTSQQSCCDTTNGLRGRWLSPDGTEVGSSGGVTVERGPSRLTLNQEDEAIVGNGVFSCEIPDSEGVMNTLYIGVYSEDSGSRV